MMTDKHIYFLRIRVTYGIKDFSFEEPLVAQW